MCIGLEEEFEEMSMIGSGVYLGNSEAFYYPQHHVRSLVSGPGGYLLAIISQSASPHHEWYLSIWCHEHGMHCMGEYPLGLFSSKDNCLTSIIWHPSGQYIYLVIGGIVILVTWKIMNQERKVIGILEFLSSFVDSFDGYNHTLEFNIVKKFDEIEVTSLTLVDHGRTCFMGTLKNKNLLISTWKFDTVRYFSVSSSLLSLGIESKELNFILGSESKSDLDSTNHGVDSETSLSLIIPQSNTSDIIVGYTNENNLFFARSALSSYVEFAPFVVIEEYSGVIQLTTYQNSRTFETTIICLAYRDVSNHSSASIIDVDIVILRLLSNPGSSSGQLTVISRTPYISNFAKIMLTDIKKHSSIYFLQSSPTFSSHPDFVVAFGDRIIGYRLDSSAVFYNVESRSNFLLIIFVIHTNEASMEFNCSRKYSRVLHSCFASDRLVTASTIEYTRDLDDKLWEGSVLHLTSLLIDLQSTVYFPSKKSSGVLFNISEKQLYIFGSQSQFTSTSNLPSNCPPVKKIVKSEISSPPKSSKLKYWDHFSPVPGLSVFALEGGSQYHITKIPKTLHRDLILNSCRINYQEKPQLTLFACLNSSHLCGGGLLLSRESVGGIYFACTFDTSIHRHLENTSTVIWLHSIHTSKWKLIQPYRYPASSSSVLLLPWKQFQRKEVNRPSEPDVINSEFPRTRKQYFNSRCAILSIKRLSWFGNHTLVLCTQREQSKNEVKDSQASAQTPVVKRHFCIELLTRKTIDPIVIRHSIHQIPELPTETRRISFPHLQCIIPLPPNFAPSHLDIVPTKSHVDHMCCNYTLHDNQMDSTHSNNESDASFHREDEVFQIRRTINRSNSGGYEKQTFKHSSGGNGSSGSVNSGTSSPGNIEAEDSCFLLLGADTRFIAFHITATTHNLEDEMFSLNRASNDANNRRKYSNTTNFQDFVSFYPSSYRVNILWDIDIHSIPLYSPSLVPMNLTLPLQDAHLSTIFRYSTSQTTVSEESTHSFISHEQHESNDSKKKSIALTSLIVRDRVGKIAHLSFYNINSVDHTYECVGTVITLGLCSSINRLQHYLFPVTASSPSTLQDIYYLHSQSDNNDVIWLPHAQTSNHHAGGVILAVLKRPNSSNMFSSPNDNICSYLSYNSPLKLLGFSEHGPLKISQSVLTLHRTSLPLTIFLSMINTNPRQMDSNSFISEFLIPFYTYSSSSTHWLKYLLSHLSLHPYPLQRLTEGLEITLKTIINRDNFTRYNPEFAVLITILFSCDDVLFIEVMSRLSRKLEPHISASLFPLPNYQIRGDYKSSKSSSDSSQRIKNYRGLIINDSPWDQLALFELCLSRCALTHAARFLTPACEQLGGSQSLESVAASLILSHELLLECFRHLQLECALECLEFCMRLDVMAAEVCRTFLPVSFVYSCYIIKYLNLPIIVLFNILFIVWVLNWSMEFHT